MTSMSIPTLGLAAALAMLPATAQPRFTAEHDREIVTLQDSVTGTKVAIAEPLCNAYEVSVKGQQLIRQTFADVAAFRARPGLNGIPLLAPFANRLDEQAFWANGKRYAFDMTLGNVRGEIPIHGFLSNAKDWALYEIKATDKAAWATCKLDFYTHPAWMKQFPFAHTLTLTYRVAADGLEVRLQINNLSTDPMPAAIGFHPYF